MSITDPTAAQQAFVSTLQNQVAQLLSSQLDGNFSFISYPSGFNYQLQGGANNYYNPSSLQEIDLRVSSGSNGIYGLNNGGTFSTLYEQILSNTIYQLSKADNAALQSSLSQSEAQQSSVISTFQNIFGNVTQAQITESRCLPQNVIGYIMWYITTNYAGNIANCPFADFRVAYQQYVALAATAVAISQAQANALARCSAAIANIKNPSASNGGFQTDINTWYVGYSGLPATTTIVSSLGPSNANNAVSVSCALSYNSTDSSNFSVQGGTQFSVPLDWITIDVGASAQYNLSQLNSLGQSLTIQITYPSVTIVGSQPALLAANNSSGWYDGNIISEIVENTGNDNTGYALASGEFSVVNTFGPGKPFARAKTLVLSQMPTVLMIFHKATLADVQKYFHEQASTSIELFGFIPLGSASESYTTTSVTQDSATGDVTVTLSPPAISGTVPPFQQTCYVLGGVIDYPS